MPEINIRFEVDGGPDTTTIEGSEDLDLTPNVVLVIGSPGEGAGIIVNALGAENWDRQELYLQLVGVLDVIKAGAIGQ